MGFKAGSGFGGFQMPSLSVLDFEVEGSGLGVSSLGFRGLGFRVKLKLKRPVVSLSVPNTAQKSPNKDPYIQPCTTETRKQRDHRPI